MTTLFLNTLNTSIAASWVVLAVLILRILLKKAPKWAVVALWGLVALRLVCPFSLEAPWSLIPSTTTFHPDILLETTPHLTTGIDLLDQSVNPAFGSLFAPNPGDSANPLQIWFGVLSDLWFIGILLNIVYAAISSGRLSQRVRGATLLRDHIYQGAEIDTPFLLGLREPDIYLPLGLDGEELTLVVAHEEAHIRRRDHWWKALGFALLALHWFNPLMWLAYSLLCRDIELACDEAVVQTLDREQQADYAQSLLSCSAGKKIAPLCPLAFGEVGVKERVRSALSYHKPSTWAVAGAILLCAAAALCFLTDPLPGPPPEREGLLSCTVVSGGQEVEIIPRYYPDGFDWDYSDLPCTTVTQEGILYFEADWITDYLRMSEQHYYSLGGSGYISKSDPWMNQLPAGNFKWIVSKQGDREDEKVIYFIDGNPGVFLMQINLIAE